MNTKPDSESVPVDPNHVPTGSSDLTPTEPSDHVFGAPDGRDQPGTAPSLADTSPPPDPDEGDWPIDQPGPPADLPSVDNPLAGGAEAAAEPPAQAVDADGLVAGSGTADDAGDGPAGPVGAAGEGEDEPPPVPKDPFFAAVREGRMQEWIATHRGQVWIIGIATLTLGSMLCMFIFVMVLIFTL